MQLATVRPSEHQRLLVLLQEPALSEEPLTEKELTLASFYWKFYASNPIGERYACEGSCNAVMPDSGLLTNDPEQTDKAARLHIELAFASKCFKCEQRHFIISEALSFHSELLRCAAAKDPRGAQKAARRRCALIASLPEV